MNMKNLNSKTPRLNAGVLALVGGILLFAVGLVLRLTFPGTIADTRLIEGLGIFLAGLGIIPLIRAASARRDPAAARRTMLNENDERALELRHRAGYIAFLFSSAVCAVFLIVYSALTRDIPGFDPIWAGLVFITVSPMIVYAVTTIWLERK
jgi:hypothetical protein